MSSTTEYLVNNANGGNGSKGKPGGDFERQAGGGGLLRGARGLVGSRRGRAPEPVPTPPKGDNLKDTKRLAKAQAALLTRTRKLVTDRDDLPLYISWMKGGSMVAGRMLASSEEIRSLWKGGDNRKATALIEIFTLAMISRWYRFLDRKLDQPETERRLARRIAAANVLQIFDEYSDESIEQAVADLIKLDAQHNLEVDQDRSDAQADPTSEEENVLGLRALWACGATVEFDLRSVELSGSNGAGESSPSIPRWTTKPEELTAFSEALDDGAEATLRFLKNRPADDLSAVAYVPVPFPRSRRFEAMVEPEASPTEACPHQQFEAPKDAIAESSTAQDGETEPDSMATDVVEPAATVKDEQRADEAAPAEPVSAPAPRASGAMAAVESPIHAIVEQLIVEAYSLADRVKDEASREAEAHASAIRADAERARDQILKPAQAHAAARAKAIVADAEQLAKGIVERASAEAETMIREATEKAASQESDAATKIRGLAERITGELQSGVSSLDEILPGAGSADDSPTTAE